jgi:hypothetical protein
LLKKFSAFLPSSAKLILIAYSTSHFELWHISVRLTKIFLFKLSSFKQTSLLAKIAPQPFNCLVIFIDISYHFSKSLNNYKSIDFGSFQSKFNHFCTKVTLMQNEFLSISQSFLKSFPYFVNRQFYTILKNS